jgi:hypothetical protein
VPVKFEIRFYKNKNKHGSMLFETQKQKATGVLRGRVSRPWQSDVAGATPQQLIKSPWIALAIDRLPRLRRNCFLIAVESYEAPDGQARCAGYAATPRNAAHIFFSGTRLDAHNPKQINRFPSNQKALVDVR